MRQRHVSWLIVVVSCLASHARAEDVECMYERRVEDFTSDPDDAYDNEYGVCTTVAGSGRRLADGTDQTKTLYITEQDDYEQFLPGDKLFLEVDAMGEDEDPLSLAGLPDRNGHAQPAWKQNWHKAIAKATTKLADKSWKDKVAAPTRPLPHCTVSLSLRRSLSRSRSRSLSLGLILILTFTSLGRTSLGRWP